MLTQGLRAELEQTGAGLTALALGGTVTAHSRPAHAGTFSEIDVQTSHLAPSDYLAPNRSKR